MGSCGLTSEDTLSIVNYPATRLPGPNLLHLLVRKCSPDRQAAIDFLASDGNRNFISYAEFHRAADTMASRITALAGHRDDSKPFVVPVLIPQSPELYVSLLAILKAGGAFCPMSLDIPLERAKFILEDVAAGVVVTTSCLVSKLPQGDRAVLLVDRPTAEEPSVLAGNRRPEPQDLAYVMYTSGSTGTPKGVGVSHDAVTQSLLAHDRHLPQFSRFLQFAAPTFDVSVFEIFFPLLRGKTLVSCTRPAMLNHLPTIISKMEVDACELTPSVAGSLLRTRQNAPNLRLLLTIGEMLTQPVVEEFGGSDERPSMLWGMYGPTEAAIHCTLQPAFAHDSSVHNIGIPLDTVSAFVLKIPLDDYSHSEFGVVPRGEIGELAVSGYQLAQRYLNRPEQTASAFIDTPYGRLYRTGDKARMLPNGSLECLGRISDGQVKLRGQRMELGEVENAALKTRGCHGAAAAVADTTLVLFCAVDGTGDMVGAIMESCRRWLPAFMLPGDIVVVGDFPRLASGKVNRKRLVAEYEAQAAATTPRGMCYKNKFEELLCRLASETLGIRVTPGQDLCKAGLDSLSAIRLASALRGAGFDIGAIDVLDTRTVTALQSRLGSTLGTPSPKFAVKATGSLELDVLEIMANHSSLSKLGQPIEAVIPCTPLQASMLAETVADARAYCNWVELRILGPEEAVKSWVLQLVQENEVLRTGFVHHNGQFLQIIFQEPYESNVSITDRIDRQFALRDDLDFLRPFRIQISSSPDSAGTTVVLQLHHAVYDGWSLDLIVSDLAALAQGCRPEARGQFRVVSEYYHSEDFRSSCDVAREFWAGNLLGFQPPALPVLCPDVTASSAVLSSSVSLEFKPQNLKTALKDIECGPQTIFQAALVWLWSSMVGSEDVVIGSIQSGRTMPITKIEDVVGPCIASVPLRTDLSQLQTVKDLLVSVQACNRAALPHNILPLSEIKQAAGIRAGQSIYDVLFVYQESLHSKDHKANALTEVSHQDYLETKLLVEVEPRDRHFDCRFTYHLDVFPAAQISIMANSIKALASYILNNLDSEISSMYKAFPPQLLSVFNPNPKTFSELPDLAHAVERTAGDFPNKDAICFADRISDGIITTTTITFAELNATADRIAWHLRQAGAREGGAVAIIAEKSIRLYAGILAILKTGCAYLPLLPSTPIARIGAILQQAAVELCLVDTATCAKLAGAVPCNLIDLQSLDLQFTPGSSTTAGPDPARLAYIIYTSGSTGVPKGVCLTQLNIMSNLDVLSRIYPVKEYSRLLQSCSQAFDVSVFEIFFAWTQGMCLCSGTNDTLFEDLERAIRKLGVTHLSMTPTVASLVDPAKVPRVEFLVTAGEAMTKVVARKWGDKLYQGYGPSETTNICSVKKMGPNQAIQHLGWPFGNTSAVVLARDGTGIVPLGCFGEFCFGGDQVAQGYLDMEELTSTKFIRHPTFGRIYRSGDLGRMLPDGSMVIIGRSDEQIKIRGQRVELNEITETIRQSANPAECATLFMRAEETSAQDQIVSFLVPRQHEGARFHVLALDEAIKQEIQSSFHSIAARMPGYMVPSAIVPISVLPATASGKLDKARLKQVFKELPKDYLEFVSYGAELDAGEGWSFVENQIAGAVVGALDVGRSEVKRWTPLSTLGLDSISAIQLSRHLKTTLGRRCPISLILQNASVARLARALLDMDTSTTEQEEISELLPKEVIDRVTGRLKQQGTRFRKILPCTPLQEAMLATATGKHQYLNRMLFRVGGNIKRLKESWDAMCIRHDILRTCFVATDDSRWPIVQVVLDRWKPYWHQFDATRSTIDDCVSWHGDGVPTALDTLEPAVSFATIAQDGSIYISFICHHALYDGVAIERLLYEVEQDFSGSTLPTAPIYDQFLRETFKLPASVDSFWLNHLAGYEPKLITHLRSELTQPCLGPLTRQLDIPLSQAKARVRELGASMLALAQSAWASALASLFRTTDICFGNVVNGRSVPVDGINELVAPCFNTIPTRIDLSGCPRNLDLIKAFQSANTDVMQYQFTPLRRIQSLMAQHDHRHLFDTLLLLQQPPRPLDPTLWTVERDDGEMDVPLVCELIPEADIDCLVVKLHTIESQPLAHGVICLMLDLFLDALRSCLDSPGTRGAFVSRALEQRLSHVHHQPPQRTHPTLQSGDSTAEGWTATESSVRTVLATLARSNSSRISRNTTIYQLGLDSISAVQIASLLRTTGFHILASDVIEHPTCGSLARYIDTQALDSNAIPAYDLVRFQAQIQPQVLNHSIAVDDVEAVIPCTPLQSAMLAQFVKSGGRDYFNHVSLELGECVSAPRLIEGWRAVCSAHPILRTGILSIDHGDSAFAMIQYHTHVFTPAVSIIPREPVEKFDLENWRQEASRRVLDTTHKGLWCAAIAEGEEGWTVHVAIHHALYDAHSLRVILDGFSKGALGGHIPAQVGAGTAAADILSQVARAAEDSAEFWKQQADKVVINRFPVMTPLRKADRDVVTESTVSSVSLETLEMAASNSGHTLQAILQAAWTRVLSAYLGDNSVVFGVVLSGRNTEATRDAVFPCITTLPVVAANSDSNHSLLAQMLQYNTELYRQQHQPLGRIQHWLGCPDTRLFDTILVYQKFDRDNLSERQWRLVGERASVDYPVSIEVEATSSGLLGYHITFFSDVLAIEQAGLLLKQFDATVRHLAFEPNGHEAELSKSCPDLFSILPSEQPEIPTAVRFLHEFVERQALRTPNVTALHFVEKFDGDAPLGRKWTYKELDDNGNRVGRILLPYTKPGDIVAVYFDKCPEAYLSVLGILKAGCAVLALDPGAPRSRNEFIIGDSGATVLVTSRQQKDNLGLMVAVPIIDVDGDLSSVPAAPPNLGRGLEPHDVCYCLYTSGTTGTPKGCEITHNNAVQCMLAFQHIFKGHWQDNSKWLQFASLHFDVSVLEQYWSWSVGITLVAAPRDLILEDLAGTITRLEITHIDLTPSLARLLHPDDVPSLCRGVFITGGESLKQEILDVWGSKGVIYNFYGPTEATIGVTVFPRVPTTGRASNIGKQFVNVGSYVLKLGTEQPVLRGGVGELCVSGRLVGKGYLKRQDLTAEKFPTLQRFGERVYRTGDLVRVLHDGCFDFLGRADDQVKLRGQRLEIGEINHAIRKGARAVRDVATLVVRNESQQKDLLVSFIVAEEGDRLVGLKLVQGLEAAELCRQARDACRSKLPGYMVPTYVLQLSFIPLSANNKAEIKELRRFFATLGQDKLMALSYSIDKTGMTLNATGAKISEVVAAMQAIDADAITPESSIFDLGIDSISVLRFSRALKKEGFEQASPSLILQHPLVGELAVALEVQQTASGFDSVTAAKQLVRACAHRHLSLVCRELGVTPDQIEYIAPCSPLQQGMTSRLAAENAYFNTFQLILAPSVSAERLRDAYQKTLDALPIFRTKFVATPDGCVQVALRQQVLLWDEVHLGHETALRDVISKTRDAWIARNQGRLSQPFEAVLVNGLDEQSLILHLFHGLYDANSLALVLDRVALEYLKLSGESTQQTDLISVPSFLDALCYGPLQDFNSSKPFWIKHLAGAARKHTSTHPRRAPAITRQLRVAFKNLELLRTSLAVTHQALVQAAWVAVLARRFSVDPTIGIVVSGRNISLDGAERVVGPVLNTLPFHARVTTQKDVPGTTWSSLIRQCHDFNITVLPFQHVPLRDIQKWCSGGKSLFDTLFSFQPEHGAMAKDKGLWTVVESQPSTDYPLALEATLGSDGLLRLLLVAQVDWDGVDNLAAMMGDLEHAFNAMLKTPDDVVCASSACPDGAAVANEHATNGLATDGHPDPVFSWTEEGVIVREEIAALAGVEPESVTEVTPIFGLGLDSIDVIKLAARLKWCGIEIKTSELAKAQTIRAILERIHAQAGNATTNGTGNNSRASERAKAMSALREAVTGLGDIGGKDVVLPATPLQESMIMEMIESDFALYFNHDIMEIAGPVDTRRLKDAWRTVIAGSPVLRTWFLPVEEPSFDSSYCQIIAKEPSVYIGDVSVGGVDELAKICDTAIHRARKGAGRSNLLQLVFASAKEQRFLVLSIAHALYDGWSLSLMHQAVQAAYEGTYRPQSFESYISGLERILFPDHRDAPAFWSGFLQGATPTILPERRLDSQDENLMTHRAEATSSISTSGVTTFCKALAVTLQTLGQACWAALLAAKTGSLDVTFGVVLSCRDTQASEELVFPMMNTVAVRSVLHGTVSTWLHYMRDNVASIGLHQHFPLREVQKLAHMSGPLFNTLFMQQQGSLPLRCTGDETLTHSVGSSAAVEYPICVEIELAEGGLVWRIACDSAYISRQEACETLKELDHILAYFVRSPESNVLLFSGQEVSVCGLPCVSIRKPDNNSIVHLNGSEEERDVWSPMEKTIRDVLAEVSGVPVGTILKSNNIYHLGLDSISAAKAISQLRKKDVTVRFRDTLKAGSIVEMARLAQKVRPSTVTQNGTSGNNDPHEVSLPEEINLPTVLHQAGFNDSAIEEVLPATPMQVHMLSAWQNTHGEVFYPCFRYTLRRQVEAANIDGAWKALVTETPILRTVFVSTNSRSTPILQLVLRPSALEQTRASTDSTRDGQTTGTSTQPYNSLCAERSDRGEWILQLRIHHALYDAVSLSTMMDKFATLCRAGRAQEVARPLFSWRNVLAPHHSEGNRRARKEFWAEYLAGAESPSLAFDKEESSSRVSLVEQTALHEVSRIAKLCKARGVSFQALLFAAYAEFLATSAATAGKARPQRVVFGIYIANRAEANEPGESFCPFLRLVPLRVMLEDGANLFDVAAQIQKDIHDISSPVNVEVGLWEIKDWMGIVVDSFVNFLGPSSPAPSELQREVSLELAQEPLADSASNLSGFRDGCVEEPLPGIARSPVWDAYPDAIDIEVLVKGDDLRLGVFGPIRRLGSSGAERVIKGIVELLVAVV